MIPAPAWQPLNRQYHADRSYWSSSMLKCFRQTPALARSRYVLPVHGPSPPPTWSLMMGSVVNALLLTQGGASVTAGTGGGIYLVDVSSRGTKAYREAAEAFTDRLVVTVPELEEAQRIAGAILQPQSRAAEVAAALLARPGFSEYAHRWTDPVTGVRCKSMMDRAIEVTTSTAAVAELKTARDPSPEGFQRACFQLDYHAQAGHNRRALADACGVPLTEVGFYFIVVRNDEPYEVAIYRPSESFLALGEAQVASDLARLRVCLDDPTGAAWRAPWERLDNDQIPTLEPPKWATAPEGAGGTEGDDADE